MGEIGYGADVLLGYVNGEQYVISLTPEQISAFIMEHLSDSVIITNVFDVPEITTVRGGLIMYCADKKFLMEKLIPVLAPMQMGEVKPPKFIPIEQDEVY